MPLSGSSRNLVTRARNLERIRQISEVAVRHGFGYFFERHNLWQTLRLRRRRPEPPSAQRGKHLRQMLEELGPTFIKFGQLLSTRPDIVPPDVLDELVKLQDKVPGFPYEVARSVIEEDLGLTLERLFVSFDPLPLGSASIGQVHRAVLPGGEAVVVKVQRPGAANQIARDIDLLYQIAELIRDHLGGRVFVDPIQVVDEFSRSIRRELDYVMEGRNAERFALNFRDDDQVRIPRVYWRYSTGRVLTMEYLYGTTLNELDFPAMALDQRRHLAETLTACWFKQMLEDGFFHADPHPANIVYQPSGTIGLLDFGIVGSLTDDDLEQGTGLFTAVLGRDVKAVKRRLRKLGVVWDASKDAQVDRTLEDVFNRYFGVSLGQMDPGQVLHDLLDLVYNLHIQLPTRFLLLDKSLLTIEGVVSQVFPDFNVWETARPYARRVIRRRFSPQTIADQLHASASDYRGMLEDYPQQIHQIFEKMRRGEFEIRFVHVGLESFGHKLDILTNRIVVTLVTVSMGVTSALIAVFVQNGPTVFGLSVWGIPGLLATLFFGIWLMWAILRSGRL